VCSGNSPVGRVIRERSDESVVWQNGMHILEANDSARTIARGATDPQQQVNQARRHM
jgi:hypothetical protein